MHAVSWFYEMIYSVSTSSPKLKMLQQLCTYDAIWLSCFLHITSMFPSFVVRTHQMILKVGLFYFHDIEKQLQSHSNSINRCF